MPSLSRQPHVLERQTSWKVCSRDTELSSAQAKGVVQNSMAHRMELWMTNRRGGGGGGGGGSSLWIIVTECDDGGMDCANRKHNE